MIQRANTGKRADISANVSSLGNTQDDLTIR